jgi:DMSO/TMAO reductase YedYZ molybdopterin-dependent catalytic subunit
MIVRSVRPEDFEMPMDGFASWLTPAERLFVRSHHYTPEVDAAAWRLEIGGLVDKPVTLTLDELKKMPKAEVAGVLECAGNGRALYEPSLIGLQWKYGAVGNGRWTGVRLADVLRRGGVKSAAREVLFDGADVPVGTMPEFRRTIPIAKALENDTILAYELNGAPVPVSHGFPLRLVVPGWAGDCWTKWVTRIELLDKEYDGFFMKTAYRHPGRPVPPGAAIDPADMQPVTSLRVKSVIATPAEGSRLGPGPVKISGAAWSGGGKPVTLLEVSTDAGRTWHPARFGPEKSQHGWRLWQYDWTPPKPAYYTIMARATDAGSDRQPFAQEWNPSGYLWNVVHEVGVEVLAAASSAPPPAPPKPAVAPELPANFKGICLTCHEMDVISQQRLTPGQWERELDKMVRWGAPVRPQDRTAFLDFLARHFGPR